MNTLRTILLVTFVSVLIWTFAEGESLQSRSATADIVFATDPALSHVVRVVDPDWRGRVDIQFEGSTARLERIEAALRDQLSIAPGMEGVPRADGEHTIDLLITLRALEAIKTRGVSVLAVNPPTLRIRVTEMTTRRIPVKVEDASGALELLGTPTLTEAEVRMPRAASVSLPESARVIARVTSEAIAAMPAGSSVNLPGVPLEPGPSLAGLNPLRILQDRTDVAGVVVRSQITSATIPSVPVVLVISPADAARWDVEVPQGEQYLTNVTVSGPSELIERILDPEDGLNVRAELRLTYSDLQTQIQSKKAEFPELSPLTFQVEDAIVSFTVRPRNGSPGGNGGAPESE